MRKTQNYSLDEKLIEIINERSISLRKSRSEVVNNLISLGLGYPSDFDMLNKVADEVEDLREIVKKIYRIDD